MEMIERVARALHNKHYEDPDYDGPLNPPILAAWESCTRSHREYWVTLARAAIEVMQDENARMQRLIQDLIDNDPNELISDAGHSVLDLWRHEARKALGPKGDD